MNDSTTKTWQLHPRYLKLARFRSIAPSTPTKYALTYGNTSVLVLDDVVQMEDFAQSILDACQDMRREADDSYGVGG